MRSRFGFSSAAANPNFKTGFRSTSIRATNSAAQDWYALPNAVDWYIERLKKVVLEQRDAFKLIKACDSEDALFYLDPPYLHDMRHKGSERCYKYEFSESDHERLLQTIIQLQGKVVLSGYNHELYNDYLSNWRKVEKSSLTDGRRLRQEILWIKDNENRFAIGAAKTAALKRQRTEMAIINAIEALNKKRQRATKVEVAKIVGYSREHIGREYSHLFKM